MTASNFNAGNNHGILHVKSFKFGRDWGVACVLVFCALIWIMIIGMEWADAAEFQSQAQSQNDDEYNFNWLDPEKKIYVLQNRKYTKALHPVLSVLGEVGLSNPYRNTYNVEGRFDFYITEMWGFELFYVYTSNVPNNTSQALNVASPNTLPNVREIQSQFGGMLHFVPWYAKINVFNAILYFDWYFGAGAGSIQSQVDTRTQASAAPNCAAQSLIGYYISTGHYYHLSQSFLFRLDVSGSFYQAPVYGTSGSGAWYSNFNFGVGLGWKI